jgi:hypothetical protein
VTPELFVSCAAAARARAALAGVELVPDDLEPPHPAFAGFRRVAYLWEEGATTYPIGDRVATWLDFLRGRGAFDAWLEHVAGPAIAVAHPASVDAWSASELEGAPLLRGRESPSHAAAPEVDHPGAAELRRASAELRDAALAAAPTASPVEHDALLRCAAILDSPGDGGEVSDVAWPYFVLLDAAYAAPARRLFAAAAAAWPLPAALPAMLAAVNSALER